MNTYLDFHSMSEIFLSAYPTSNLYFLLDHGGLPGLRQKLSESSTAWVSLFDETKEVGALDLAPVLIMAGSNRRVQIANGLLEWLGRKSTYTSTTIVLSSPLPIDLMRMRLKARLDVRLSEDMDAMLRYFDPRVLENLGRVLTVEQSSAFFNLAQAWWYIDRVGQLSKIDSEFHLEDDFSPPLALTQTQEFDLIELSETDQAFYLIKKNFPLALTHLPPHGQYIFLQKKIEAAKKLGLDSVLKYVLYIVVPILEEEKFVNTSSWQCFLDKLRRNDFDFSELFANTE